MCFKENVSASSLNVFSSQPDCKRLHDEQQLIARQSRRTIKSLEQELSRSVNRLKSEANELELYKSEFKFELKELECELDRKLTKIAQLQKKSIKELQKVSSAHEDDSQELRSFYENKLARIREENSISKQTMKELILSREAELSRVLKDTDSAGRQFEQAKQETQGHIVELKEQIKAAQKQRK